MIDNKEAYDLGFRDGLATYSWMKDGTTFVGTTGKTLKDAQNDYRLSWNYFPEKVDDNNSISIY